MSIPYDYDAASTSGDKNSSDSNEKQTNQKALSAKQQKLRELRQKLVLLHNSILDTNTAQNQARKNNRNAAAEEEYRKLEGPGAEKKRQREEWEQERLKEREKLKQLGLDPEKEELLSTTAARAEISYKKNKKEGTTSFGWDQFNPESQFNAYNKRVKDLDFKNEEYEKQKAELDEDEFYPDTTNPTLAPSYDVPKENVDRMVAELNKR